MTTPPVCNYEGSDYQKLFWDEGGRAYEDRTEAIALKRLLPKSGRLMLELGAGAGRNTARYMGYERIVGHHPYRPDQCIWRGRVHFLH